MIRFDDREILQCCTVASYNREFGKYAAQKLDVPRFDRFEFAPDAAVPVAPNGQALEINGTALAQLMIKYAAAERDTNIDWFFEPHTTALNEAERWLVTVGRALILDLAPEDADTIKERALTERERERHGAYWAEFRRRAGL
ncbi:hypothetical protein [Neoaquamicrobium sediminum]